MVRLCRLTRSFPPLRQISSGLDPGIYSLTIAQSRIEEHVCVISRKSESDTPDVELLSDNVMVYRVNPPYALSSMRKLIELCEERSFDVLHLHATSSFLTPLLKKTSKKLAHTKCVVHVHGTTKGVRSRISSLSKELPETVQSIHASFSEVLSIARQQYLWKNSDGVIAVSKFIANEVKELYGIPEEKIFVACNGVDPLLFSPRKEAEKMVGEKYDLLGCDFVGLYLGGYRLVKGVFLLLRALTALDKRLRKRFKLIFVGKPTSSRERVYEFLFKETIKRADLADSIVFVESIIHSQMPYYYSAATATLIPSLYEACPKAALESMACETPVIATDCGGVSEILPFKDFPMITEITHQSFSEALSYAIESGDSIKCELGKKCRLHVCESLSWEKTAESIHEIYERI